VLSREERTEALRLARRAIDRALAPTAEPDPDAGEGREASAEVFREKRGVFVTLKHYPDDELLGCIGHPLPVLPLVTALTRAAVAAATDDPRFRPIRAAELPHLRIEVSVLTVPTQIHESRPEAVPASIVVGRDGLIVEGFGTSGLLLPQVAPEQGWTAEEFLAGTCEKAGLPRGAWRRPEVTIRRFEAEVFGERSPGGELAEEVPRA